VRKAAIEEHKLNVLDERLIKPHRETLEIGIGGEISMNKAE